MVERGHLEYLVALHASRIAPDQHLCFWVQRLKFCLQGVPETLQPHVEGDKLMDDPPLPADAALTKARGGRQSKV